jgi:hypothetical protein
MGRGGKLVLTYANANLWVQGSALPLFGPRRTS